MDFFVAYVDVYVAFVDCRCLCTVDVIDVDVTVTKKESCIAALFSFRLNRIIEALPSANLRVSPLEEHKRTFKDVSLSVVIGKYCLVFTSKKCGEYEDG